MKKKKLPKWVSNQLLGRIIQSKPGTYISYWIFQGMLYMDYREVVSKLLIDIILSFFIYYISKVPLSISFLIAHTFNMFFNGHYFAMRRHMGLGKTNPKYFINYTEKLQERVKNNPHILAAAAYGSLSNNVFRPTSDIDIRFIPYNNTSSFFRVCFFAFFERARALLMKFPLDLYVFDIAKIDKKMNPKEPPIIFHDPKNMLRRKYDKILQADDFIVKFKSTYID
jgi:predicted nucleotidyltransferase